MERGEGTMSATDVGSHPIAATEENFTETVVKSDLPVLVDFWAPWCGPCRMIAPVLERLAGELAGRVRIVKVNVDESPGLGDRHQVTSIPTLVLYKNGREAERQIGALPPDALKRWLEAQA
jgi:thioredoxin